MRSARWATASCRLREQNYRIDLIGPFVGLATAARVFYCALAACTPAAKIGVEEDSMLDLTAEQRIALENGEPVPCVIGATQCVVVRKEAFDRLQHVAYDDSEWTTEEMTALAERTLDAADTARTGRIKRGDIVLALYPMRVAHGPRHRPVLIVQADYYNQKISNVLVASISSNLA